MIRGYLYVNTPELLFNISLTNAALEAPSAAVVQPAEVSIHNMAGPAARLSLGA